MYHYFDGGHAMIFNFTFGGYYLLLLCISCILSTSLKNNGLIFSVEVGNCLAHLETKSTFYTP